MPPIAVPTISPVVIVTIDLSPVVTNLVSLVTYLVLIFARFALIALTEFVMTSIFQFLQLALVVTQSFTLPVIAGRVVVVGVRTHTRDDLGSRQQAHRYDGCRFFHGSSIPLYCNSKVASLIPGLKLRDIKHLHRSAKPIDRILLLGTRKFHSSQSSDSPLRNAAAPIYCTSPLRSSRM